MGVANKTKKHRHGSRSKTRRANLQEVAILFYGRVSSYEHSLEYINSIYKNPRFKCVVFCSLNLKEKSPYIAKFCKEFDIADEQINIEPTELPALYTEDKTSKTYCDREHTNCYNVYSMFYHQGKAFKLMETYEKRHKMDFDTVVVLRADMNAKKKPNAFPILNTIRPNTIYIPKASKSTYINSNGLSSNGLAKEHASNYYKSGITTLAAYGDTKAMKKYTSLIQHLNSALGDPETMLFKHLKDMGLSIKRFTHSINLNPERNNSKYPSE